MYAKTKQQQKQRIINIQKRNSQIEKTEAPHKKERKNEKQKTEKGRETDMAWEEW